MENRLRGRSRKKLTTRAYVVIVCLIGILAAMQHASLGRQNEGADAVAVQTAIENGNRAYLAALKGRDARRFAMLFAEDAISLPPSGPPIRGRADIEAAMSSAFERVVFLDGTMHTLELRLATESAVEIGSYRYAILADGVPEELQGRYLTIWRPIGGAWKIAVDSSQPGAPVPVGSTPESSQSPAAAR